MGFRQHGEHLLATESSFYTELTALTTDPIIRTIENCVGGALTARYIHLRLHSKRRAPP